MELTINVPDMLFEQISDYRRATHKRTSEEVVTELLRYALTLSPRQRLLDMLRSAPEGRANLSEDEQMALTERVRQRIFEEEHDA
jgi:hypothetical protein